jgi:hemerythrin-like domain-containing protein
MRADHRRVLAAVDEAERLLLCASQEAARARIAQHVQMLEEQFTTHMEAEDRVLLPSLEALLPEARSVLAELSAEHVTLRALRTDLAEALRSAGGAQERFVVPLRDLIDLLRIHIRKEEALVFHVAEQILTPAQRGRISRLLDGMDQIGCDTEPGKG